MNDAALLNTETYYRKSSVVFRKTDEVPYGGLSNMAGGFPLRVNGIELRTSEALYQCCRYPHDPETQRWVLDQSSPMWTKKVPGRDRRSRADWNEIRVEVMRWCLRVKLAQHLEKFGALLWITEQRPIVEESHKDDFWGTLDPEKKNGPTLVGSNVLGKLLMELRAEFIVPGDQNRLKTVQPLAITNFRLMGEEIGVVG
jgi:ribA/ribD-fused uncharacterized protein